MSTIVNGIITIASWDSTGNPGEYTITGAIFQSQSDTTGNGAYLVQPGFVIYVPASDPNTFAQIPGVVHRYQITSVDIVDVQTINATVLWNEVGPEIDTPTNGVDSIISAVTPNRQLGLPVDPLLYNTLPAGAATSAYNIDTSDILDEKDAATTFKYTQTLPLTQWEVVHNMNNADFIYSLFNSNGQAVIADSVIAVDVNTVQVNVLEAMAGKLILLFVS